jgi:hypothetical protein
MTPAKTPTPPRWPDVRFADASARDGRSRQERLAALTQLGKAGVRKAGA